MTIKFLTNKLIILNHKINLEISLILSSNNIIIRLNMNKNNKKHKKSKYF